MLWHHRQYNANRSPQLHTVNYTQSVTHDTQLHSSPLTRAHSSVLLNRANIYNNFALRLFRQFHHRHMYICIYEIYTALYIVCIHSDMCSSTKCKLRSLVASNCRTNFHESHRFSWSSFECWRIDWMMATNSSNGILLLIYCHSLRAPMD